MQPLPMAFGLFSRERSVQQRTSRDIAAFTFLISRNVLLSCYGGTGALQLKPRLSSKFRRLV
ncbi:unnamed protein product [Chondrus crispus]|uniref:Uncharacterized protein n=1 Tax=Chondrus crispus TaxID=2769 RepID=R7QJR4_CHOCR|nr:unnamed protein product [Chondrus crispus]CDF38762.1 unnamed protein product [Chondrus crispus]|eukprot:XP_005718667.1 unnamed protein product [Chondrus crispus]